MVSDHWSPKDFTFLSFTVNNFNIMDVLEAEPACEVWNSLLIMVSQYPQNYFGSLTIKKYNKIIFASALKAKSSFHSAATFSSIPLWLLYWEQWDLSLIWRSNICCQTSHINSLHPTSRLEENRSSMQIPTEYFFFIFLLGPIYGQAS